MSTAATQHAPSAHVTPPSDTKQNKPTAVQPTAAQVAWYLQQNPDFLAHYPELIPQLVLPGAIHGDNVANLQGFQLTKLQQKLTRLQQQNRQLLTTAQQNDASANAIYGLVIDILRASTLSNLRKTLTQRLTHQFGLNNVRLLLKADLSPTKTNTISDEELAEACPAEQLVRQRSLRGEDAHKKLHGKTAADIQSEALLQLHNEAGSTIGLLVLGANSNSRFYAGQGSAFLEFLAPVLGLTVARLIKS